MRLLILLTMMLITTNGLAQSNRTKKEHVPNFKNQGEQEEYWAKKVFEKKREKRTFERYSGRIVAIDNYTFGYDDNIIKVDGISEELKEIFRLGIIHSAIIGGSKNQDKLSIDSMNAEQRAIYSFIRIDTLSITNMEELKALSNSFEVKRFRFLLWRKGLANPMLYFFELRNNSANKETGLPDFIKYSQLTFFEMQSILI